MDNNTNYVEQLRSQIATTLFLHYGLIVLAFWGFIWGTTVLGLRVATQIPETVLLWGVLGILPALAVSVILIVPRIPAYNDVCALVDQQNQCGGLLMASAELGTTGWQQHIPQLHASEIHFHGTKPVSLFLTAAIFVAVCFLVPKEFANALQHHKLEIGNEVEKLENKIEILEKENILDPKKAEMFKKRLKQLVQESSGDDPAKTWEALDHMEHVANKTAKEFSSKALQATQEMNKLETLAKGLQEGAQDMDPKLMQQAMAELSEMMQKAAAEEKQIEKYLSQELMKACQNGNLSKEQLKSLMNAMKNGKQDLQKTLEQLQKNGMCDQKSLELNKEKGQCNSCGLKEFLEKNKQNMSVSQMTAIWCNGLKPGKGGVDEGGGPVPMVFGDPTSEEGVKFKEQPLPQASLDALKDSQKLGVSIGAPTPDTSPDPFQGGVLPGSQDNGGSAFRQSILPRHRHTVKQYFTRTK